MDQGITMIDDDLNLVMFNERAVEILEFPDGLFKDGMPMADLLRYNAERGEYGPGDAEEHVRTRIELAKKFEVHHFERARPDGMVIEIRGNPVESGGFVTTYTDITERKQAEEAIKQQTQLVRLLHESAVSANQAQEVEDALRGCVEAVCTYNSWPVGHVYVCPPNDPDTLVSADIWHLDDPDHFATFRQISEEITFARGIGLPGRVLESGEPEWIVDVTKDKNFPRAKLAGDIGVKAGFAVPVMVGDEVTAVMEFFAAEAIDPEESLLSALDNVAAPRWGGWSSANAPRRDYRTHSTSSPAASSTRPVSSGPSCRRQRHSPRPSPTISCCGNPAIASAATYTGAGPGATGFSPFSATAPATGSPAHS